MPAFSDHLKTWRGARRLSQLDLGLQAGVSARHVSFLESGRAKPSRMMVLRLAQALEMPRGAANAAMRAAGFAEVFPSFPMSDAALAPIREAVAYLLERHAPLPAVAIDRTWNLIDANAPAVPFFGAPIGEDGATGNVIQRLIDTADGDLVENWVEAARMTLMRLQAEIAQFGGDDVLEAYAKRLAAHPRLQSSPADAVDWTAPVIPLRLRAGETQLSLFSTIAHFTSVQDVNAADIKIELMFPADAPTRAFFGAP